jgi:hypothetical protein
LNEESNERQKRLMSELVAYEPTTMKPLQAVPEEGGSGVTVFLKGENLSGNNNRLYWPRDALKKLRAQIPYEALCRSSVFKNAKEKLKIVGEDIHEVLEYEAYSVSASGPLHPIGHYGIQIESDYVRDPSIKHFSSEVNCIDLGRYGPFRKEGKAAGGPFSAVVSLHSHLFLALYRPQTGRSFCFEIFYFFADPR